MDLTLQDIGSEEMVDSSFDDDSPFRISARGDWIQRSKINKKHLHRQHVNFHTAEVQGEGIVYYNRDCKEGISLGIGYNHSRFDWNHNPYFSCKDMNQVSFTAAAFSARLQNWLWQASATVNWEPKYSNFADYTNYDLVLWGRYSCHRNANFHIGFLAQTGMKIDQIWPIIGFDWTFCQKWKLNVVFPVNISLVYTINDNWSAAVAGRMFNIRYRFGKHEHLKKALLRYYNNGVELAINYSQGPLYANLHAGMTLWGQFRISDSNNKHKKHFDMDPAPYVGGELACKF